MREIVDIDPMSYISPNKRFTLPDKYDIIFMNMSNIMNQNRMD